MTPPRRQVIAAALVLGLAGPALAAHAPAHKPALAPDDMSLGNSRAKVTVIEYASASCPHCAHFNNEVFPAFKAKYIDTGKIHYVFREFLTPPPEVAAAGFLVARCAGKDKYFKVLDIFFRGQQRMYETGDVTAALVAAGQSGGLDAAKIDACLDDQAAADAMQARIERYAKDDGINSTPTFVINGKKIEGVATLAQLDAAIGAAR